MAIKRKPTGDQGLNEYALNNNRTTEYLTELQGREGSIQYRRMAKGDAVVGMILRVHKNPIRSASWNIPYPSDMTDQEKQAIDLIKDYLFGKKGTKFDKLLGKILSMIEYGYSLFEQYYSPEKKEGNVYLMPVIEQRMQTSIEEILPEKRIVKQITIKGGTTDIPFDDLIFFVLNQQGEDLRGESMLRNAYIEWKNKMVYKEWLGIGIQRSVSGVPSMEVPKGTQPTDENYIAAEDLLKKICLHENAYMITLDGWKFDVHESKFNASPVQKAIDSCNSEMTLSVLAQFILLGQQGNTGAFALSRDQSDFFLDGLQYIVDLVAGVLNDYVIAPFLKINFGDAVDPSRVVISGMNLNKKAGKELSEVLNTLKSAGFIKPTVDDEIQLRNNLELPELSEEDIEKRRNPPLPAPVPPVQPEPIKLAEPKTTVAKKRREFIEKSEREMSDLMKANLMLIKDKMMADIEATLKRGTVEIQGLKNISISSSKYLKNLQNKLAGIAVDSWNRAKSEAKANKIKLSEPKDIQDKALKAFVLNQSVSIVDKQTAAMLNRAILTASNNMLKGFSATQALANTSKSVDAYITSSGVIVDGSLVVVGTSNFGESQFYNEISDQIWGYEFIGIDDAVQSEICRWYNGKKFSVNSVEASQATPPLHPNCRSYLRPIYKSEAEPEIDDVVAPPSIMQGKTIF